MILNDWTGHYFDKWSLMFLTDEYKGKYSPVNTSNQKKVQNKGIPPTFFITPFIYQHHLTVTLKCKSLSI